MNNQFRQLTLGATLALATVLGAQAQAAVVAENTHVDNEGAGNNHFSFDNAIGAENFSLDSGLVVTRLSFVAHHDAESFSNPSSIDWYLYAADGSTPGAVLASGPASTYHTNAEGSSGSYTLMRYLIDVSVDLVAGDYWVGFHLNTINPGDPHWTFASAGTSFDGLSALSNDGGATWGTPYPGGNMTFRVESGTSPVPLPAPLALLGTALGALVLRRRAA